MISADPGACGAGLSAADEQLLRELTERARARGLKLTGEGGLLGKLMAGPALGPARRRDPRLFPGRVGLTGA